MVAYASMNSEEPTPALVSHVLGRLGENPVRDSYGLSEIVDAAAQEFGVESRSVMQRDRRRAVVTARQVAMFLARELTDLPQTAIARGTGAGDHSTVVHAQKKIAAATLSDPAMRSAVDNVRRRLGVRT